MKILTIFVPLKAVFHNMKRSFLRIFMILQLILVPLFIAGVFADPPGPPGPGGPPGTNGGVPVGAPIDNGIVILLALGMAYGCYKIYEIRKKRMVMKEEKAATLFQKLNSFDV